VTGASVMGAVFMAGAGVDAIDAAGQAAVVAGTHVAFLVAALLAGLALAIVVVAAKADIATRRPAARRGSRA
jgi:hypothetical protein